LNRLSELLFEMNRGDGKQLVLDYFRCPGEIPPFSVAPGSPPIPGFFRLNADTICYGQCSSVIPASAVGESRQIAADDIKVNARGIQLPFDPVEAVDNLRCEKYYSCSIESKRDPATNPLVREIYYLGRPFIPRIVRKRLQQTYFRGWNKVPFPKWPVDTTVERIHEQLLILAMKAQGVSRVPFIWFWPDGAHSCAIMTHDVETSRGLNYCRRLMDLNDSFAIKSSFQIVPEKRYNASSGLLDEIRARGFEICVHDLNHDGRLFSDHAQFLNRAKRIKQYQVEFGAKGFRSAVLYRNADWFGALDFSYDMSIPNVAHLDPQRGGCCTVFPFLIGNIVELPVTTTQDYSLFHILGDYSTRLWREQISIIRAKHGLMSFIIHPDYIIREKARKIYTELLLYLAELRAKGETWIALPMEVAAWWRMRNQMEIVGENGCWRIEGEGSERADLAFAVLENDSIVYEVGRQANEQPGFNGPRASLIAKKL
jgi:peptidoglycan/xylan/chitin deacetylase (PgdA/CDA1 family)